MRRMLWVGDSILIVAGVTALITNGHVRSFASQHGVLMYCVALAFLVTLTIAGDQVLATRAQRDEAICLFEEAEARYPLITARDQRLFDRIDQEMGRGTTPTRYLEAGFHGKVWNWRPMQPYLSFADDWGYDAMFDDPVMEEALRAFHSVASDFYSDAATESVNRDKGTSAELASGADRELYGTEWRAVRDRLIEKAHATSAARDALYVLGRQRGY